MLRTIAAMLGVIRGILRTIAAMLGAYPRNTRDHRGDGRGSGQTRAPGELDDPRLSVARAPLVMEIDVPHEQQNQPEEGEHGQKRGEAAQHAYH
jgi:hypothetical protein